MQNHTMQEKTPQVLEVTEQKPKGLIPLNRKQRRAQEKKRRSKVFQKAEEKRLAKIQKQITEQIRLQAELEALNDVVFADPRNVDRIRRVFEPVTQSLDSLVATGVVNAMPDGTPLLWVAEDGCYYPAHLALQSVVETYEKLSRTFAWNDHSDGLRRLAKRLELQMPVFQEDVDEARKTIEWMKFCTMTITPRQFTREAQEVQIKNELEDKGLVS